MLHTEVRAGLRRLVATFKLTSFPSSMGGAQQRPAHRRLRAVLECAPLATSVRRAEKLVTCAFEAARIGTPPAATVCDAELGRTLGALSTAFLLAAPSPPVCRAILGLRPLDDVIASVHQAHRDATFFTGNSSITLSGKTIVLALPRTVPVQPIHIEDLVGSQAYARVPIAVLFDAGSFQEGAPLKVTEVSQRPGGIHNGIGIGVFGQRSRSLSSNYRGTGSSTQW